MNGYEALGRLMVANNHIKDFINETSALSTKELEAEITQRANDIMIEFDACMDNVERIMNK